MFERYTPEARRAIFYARQDAIHRGANAISTVNLLLGLSYEDNSRANAIASLKDRLNSHLAGPLEIAKLPCSNIPYLTDRDIPLTDQSKMVLTHAVREANRARHLSIDTDDLFCGLLCFPNDVSKALLAQGMELSEIRAASKQSRKDHPPEGMAPARIARIAAKTMKPAIVRIGFLILVVLLVVLILWAFKL